MKGVKHSNTIRSIPSQSISIADLCRGAAAALGSQRFAFASGYGPKPSYFEKMQLGCNEARSSEMQDGSGLSSNITAAGFPPDVVLLPWQPRAVPRPSECLVIVVHGPSSNEES